MLKECRVGCTDKDKKAGSILQTLLLNTVRQAVGNALNEPPSVCKFSDQEELCYLTYCQEDVHKKREDSTLTQLSSKHVD